MKVPNFCSESENWYTSGLLFLVPVALVLLFLVFLYVQIFRS